MDILNFFITPIMGGVIAMSTNWLAIRMLFRPHTEKRIFGIRLPFTPGLIPKERARIAGKMAEAISTRLLTPEVLAAELQDPTLWPIPNITVGEAAEMFGLTNHSDIAAPIGEKLKPFVDSLLPKIASGLENLSENYPELDAKFAEFTYQVVDENVGKLAGMFISKEKIYKSIKDGASRYLRDSKNHEYIKERIDSAIDALMTNEAAHNIVTEKFFSINIREALTAFLTKEKHAVERVLGIVAGYLAEHMPIQNMIENKIADFDMAEVEDIILSVAGRELRVIVMLGGVLGFLIGLLAVLF